MIIARRYRHARRLQAVARVLVHHGFGYLLGQLGFTEYLTSYRRRLPHGLDETQPLLSRGERVRRVLEELGPTFVKMGQMLITRPDLLPEDIRSKLAKLQDQVPPFPFTQIQSLIERELADPWGKFFPISVSRGLYRSGTPCPVVYRRRGGGQGSTSGDRRDHRG